MKNTAVIKLSVIFLITIAILSNCTDEVDYESLVERNGIKYKVNSEEGYTGNSVGYHNNGQKAVEASFIDGQLDGKYSEWYSNGYQKSQKTYANGKSIGEHVLNDSMGHLFSKTNFDSSGTTITQNIFSESKNNHFFLSIVHSFSNDNLIQSKHYDDNGVLTLIVDDSTAFNNDYKRYRYFENGEVTIDNIVRNGYVSEYWDGTSGAARVSYQVADDGFTYHGKYLEMREDGIHIVFYGQYENNLKTGIWTWFNEYSLVEKKVDYDRLIQY